MKKIVISVLSIYCIIVGSASADPTPFSTNISKMWLDGKKNEVLNLANQRLQGNSNDLAGLIITLEYRIECFDIANIGAAIDKVIAAGALIKTSSFIKIYPQLKSDLLYGKNELLPQVTSEMAQSEAYKGNIKGKPMTFLYVLQAAEADGLIK